MTEWLRIARPRQPEMGRSLVVLADEYIRIMPFCSFRSCEG